MPSSAEMQKRFPGLVDALEKGSLSVFLGAGFSRIAGLPLWGELMEPLAQSLQLPAQSDPVQIAQYYVNANAQGRHLLNRHLAKELGDDRIEYSAAHQYLKELPLRFILTTNFDRAVERTFDQEPRREYDVIIDDEDIAYTENATRTPIVKANGCISRRASIILTREDFEQYTTGRPQMCDLIRTALATTTVLYIGTSFSDPIFPTFNAQVLGRLECDRRPAYMVKLRSSRYEEDDYRRRGIEIINLGIESGTSQGEITAEITKLIESLVRLARAVPGPATQRPSGGDAGSAGGSLLPTLELKYQTLLVSRLGTGLSLQVNPEHVDYSHRYDLLFREDLLDYKSGDFYSIRRISGKNVSDRLSSHFVYAESSEQKLAFRQTGIRAFEVATKSELLVEPLHDPDAMAFTHAFRIFFPAPLDNP